MGQVRLYIVSKQNSRKKRGIERFWCTVFKMLRQKNEKNQRNWMHLPQECAVSFSQKIFLCNSFGFWMNSFEKIFSKF